MKVLNKKTDVIPPNAVYVGRPSKWGNPVTVKELKALCPGDNKTELHQRAVEWYKRYLAVNPNLQEQLGELRSKDLVCWCNPLPCHADVLIQEANK